MKFNWGTGILIFLILFLAACAVFIIFAMRQDVNLVHPDYYEKGVDFTDQMNVDARSNQYDDKIKIEYNSEYLIVEFEKSLVSGIDSGEVLLYRPSGSKFDVLFPLNFSDNMIKIPRENLIQGRYILKLTWYSDGLEYEVDKQVNFR